MRVRGLRWATSALAFATLCVSATASATTDATAARLAGEDRVATAIAISQHEWDVDAAGAVVLARSDAFPDALAGGPLAVAERAPLLLTPPGTLDPRVGAEIDRVLAAGGAVRLLGGDAAISPQVVAELHAKGYRTTRFGGADRFETAAMIARDGLGSAVETVLLADGMTFPDALVAGAAAPSVNGALVLTAGTAMPQATSAYLSGPGANLPNYAVGAAAASAAPSATPLAGADPYETSTLVAGRFAGTAAVTAVASGATFPDGLTGGAHVAGLGGAVLLTDPGHLPSVVDSFLRRHASTLRTGFVYGGTSAISDAVLAQVRSALRDPFHTFSSTAKSVLRESAQSFGGHLVRWEKPVITIALKGNWTPGTLDDAVTFWNDLLAGFGVQLRASAAPADMVFEMTSTPDSAAPSNACGQEGPTAYDGYTITGAGGQLWPTYGECGAGRAGNEASWDRTAIRHSVGHSLGLLSHTPSGSDVMGSPDAAAGDSPVLREVVHYLYSVPAGTQPPS